MARQSCAMVHRWPFFGDFLRPAFSASHMQQVSGMHCKLTLRPHYICGSMVDMQSLTDIQSPTAENRRGKKKEDRNHNCKIECPHLLHIKMVHTDGTLQSSLIKFTVVGSLLQCCTEQFTETISTFFVVSLLFHSS